MDNFVVSARKYRPVTFDTVIGQPSITSTLKNAIRNNHLAQAFLFCGPRGVGKTTCARILAKTINCMNLSEDLKTCDKCESCVSFNRSNSFNIHELDAASNNSVEDIRTLIEQVRIPPQIGKYKIYIIDEVQMLSQQAFNAFLKTLEEPPAYAKFILATTEKHKIIPTILSRCQIFDFKRISIEDIAKHLKFVADSENVTADPDALHIIAQKADGALRDALSIFDQIVSFSGNNITYKDIIENLNVLDYDYYFKLIEYLLKGDISSSLLLVNEVIENGFDGQYFITGLGEHLRNILVCKDSITLKLLEAGTNIKDRYKDQSEKCSQNFILKALEINSKCDVEYKSSNNKRLLLELSVMQMCMISSIKMPEKAKEELSYPAEIPDKSVKKTEKISRSNASVKIVEADIPKIQSVPTATPGISQNPVKEQLPKTISISKKELSEKNVEKNQVKEDLNKYEKSSDFTQTDLEKIWNKYAELVMEDSPSFYSTLMKRKPALQENYVVEILIDNKVQEGEIMEKKSEMMEYLRKNLDNFKIQLKTIITESKEEDKPYTPVDKYKKMAEKHPVLDNMKNQLNLEIDF